MKPARLLPSLALLLAACGGTMSVPQAERDAMRKVYDEAFVQPDGEPLCVGAGPFPYRSGTTPDRFRGIGCDKCQALAQAGFLVRRYEGDAVVYDLSEDGRKVYRTEVDPAFLDVVRERFRQQGRNEEPDERAFARPRLCFGQTRFHDVVDALGPMSFSGNTVRSVKIVAVATDTSGVLFEPRVAALGLPVPPKPEAGKPALYPPKVVSFEWVRGDPQPSITDVRYGAWIDAD
ncbi:MAG TPA: hypothetical protein VFL14_11470 [Xanthomonadales bacterium]|nr:hypothetical protein [Xanthomonadales bacterium]